MKFLILSVLVLSTANVQAGPSGGGPRDNCGHLSRIRASEKDGSLLLQIERLKQLGGRTVVRIKNPATIALATTALGKNVCLEGETGSGTLDEPAVVETLEINDYPN